MLRINDGGVLRFDARTGAPLPANGNPGASFVAPDTGTLDGPDALTFGRDGNLYVTSVRIIGGAFPQGAVLRFDGTTGAFIDEFVPYRGDLGFPTGIAFGPDGDLYVSDTSFGGGGAVLRFDGTSGHGLGMFTSGGPLTAAGGIVFGPDGNLYVSNPDRDSVLRYSGMTGAFLDLFIPVAPAAWRHLRIWCLALIRTCTLLARVCDGSTEGPVRLSISSPILGPSGSCSLHRPLPMPSSAWLVAIAFIVLLTTVPVVRRAHRCG